MRPAHLFRSCLIPFEAKNPVMTVDSLRLGEVVAPLALVPTPLCQAWPLGYGGPQGLRSVAHAP